MQDKKLLSTLQRGARTSAEKHSSKYFAEQVLDVYQKAIDTQKNSLKTKLFNLLDKVSPWKK